jgi:hypothetical protein
MNGLGMGMTPQQLFGQHAMHLPINMIAQDNGIDDALSGVFQMRHPDASKLIRNSEFPHVLILGDMIIRPHLIMGTHRMVGHGIGGVYTDGWNMSEWVKDGEILFDAGVGR